jgi:hypothetical protein
MRTLLIASFLVLAAGCGHSQKQDPSFAHRATSYQQPRQPQPMLGGDRPQAVIVTHGY